MVSTLRNSTIALAVERNGTARQCAILLLIWLAAPSALRAQQSGMHYRHRADWPPGAIGSEQLRRGGPLPGYFQPVEIRAPQGALVSAAAEGGFDEPTPAPRHFGLLIAPVYRFQVTRIPLHPGAEVYPTIELVNRTYAPTGVEKRFPIVIELDQDDLELALQGKFVTKVVYLEDPDKAIPASAAAGAPLTFDARPSDDPLEMADAIGKPMAIVRLGGRLPIPGANVDEEEWLTRSCAPLIKYPSATAAVSDDGSPVTVEGVRPAAATSPARRPLASRPGPRPLGAPRRFK
ncbi:MAG: hypothetical protein AB7U73_00105 [Pirellulales bacterium]